MYYQVWDELKGAFQRFGNLKTLANYKDEQQRRDARLGVDRKIDRRLDEIDVNVSMSIETIENRTQATTKRMTKTA